MRRTKKTSVRKRNGASIETYDIFVGNVTVGSVENRVGSPRPWAAKSVISRRGAVVTVQETFDSKSAAVSSIVDRHKTTPPKPRPHNRVKTKLRENPDLQAVKRRLM